MNESSATIEIEYAEKRTPAMSPGEWNNHEGVKVIGEIDGKHIYSKRVGKGPLYAWRIKRAVKKARRILKTITENAGPAYRRSK